ncbi:hypothetical protein A3E41_05075 [Candidatus Woesebacteria bacterium RIFCSPHIGHO2_12_FULL_38_9]|uniref:Uncharacterized protein n=1 Tax=Candidatus Woesebacteria bacterium RIFCSPHIGHO2_01_FULL_40_22 TaxID=1802499 RepID=A0A1F7YKQ8_9BACT|nr:MAG: hypothetical protein A2141_05875 [Candidatus Woesebacteria bacterium RBG_16_40_11]OGM27178.1 MAG: hypothetical protein A2628_04025 [Candidatus Woesebacteria bacterium RIFCSPHIGHO2_01_FULL_40_22]OGM36914.1 MAG: hypothetical protein A3E41_05075 [Candidatus Woesebacteria bacterium RIFCSPHIGHO2_12_FULL_38_9]
MSEKVKPREISKLENLERTLGYVLEAPDGYGVNERLEAAIRKAKEKTELDITKLIADGYDPADDYILQCRRSLEVYYTAEGAFKSGLDLVKEFIQSARRIP